jgi:hypothetical protein
MAQNPSIAGDHNAVVQVSDDGNTVTVSLGTVSLGTVRLAHARRHLMPTALNADRSSAPSVAGRKASLCLASRHGPRRTGLARNRIRKDLGSAAVEPKFKGLARPSKLDRFADTLAHWLKVEAGRSRRHKRTAKRLHAYLVILGDEGSGGRVAAFVREW